MKKSVSYKLGIFIFVATLFCSSSTQAQTKLSPTTNSFRMGDRLMKETILADLQDVMGNDVVWDLRSSSALSTRPLLSYHSPQDAPEVVISSELFSNNRYVLSNCGLYRTGYTTPTLRMHYDVPEQILSFPLQYGDSISSSFSGSGIYSDRLHVREYGSSSLKADASGIMLLPDGDTLRHVMRVTKLRDTYIEMSPTDSLPPVPTPGATSCHRIVEHRWYAAGYRYPVLEQVEGIPQVLFFPPAAQETQVAEDEANEQVRQLVASRLFSDDYAEQGRAPIIHYSMTSNPERSTVGIDFDLEAPATVRLLLSDVTGVVYRQALQDFTAGTGFHMELSLAGLPHRQYVLHISAGPDTFSEKVINRQ